MLLKCLEECSGAPFDLLARGIIGHRELPFNVAELADHVIGAGDQRVRRSGRIRGETQECRERLIGLQGLLQEEAGSAGADGGRVGSGGTLCSLQILGKDL